MGFIAPAIPWIAKGAGMVAGHFAGKAAQKGAMERSPEEAAAIAGAQGAAGSMGQAGAGLLGQAKPWLGQAGNYYQTLLRGNRAAMSQAVAAPTAQLTDVYRGATRNLERSGLQGAQRDVATADLNRDRASKIAGLVTGVQPMAAQQLGELGYSTAALGGNLTSQAGNVYEKLLGQGFANRKYAREEGGKTAGAIGGLVADLGGILAGKFGAKKPIQPRMGPQHFPISTGPTAPTQNSPYMTAGGPNPYALALPGTVRQNSPY